MSLRKFCSASAPAMTNDVQPNPLCCPSSPTCERSRVLERRHTIRQQPDITFRQFAETYLRDHAELHKRSVDRDREILAVLKRSFGSLLLHEITAHRIEQFKRERLAGKWRGHNATAGKPIRPGTVNRELDTLRDLFSKAVEWARSSRIRCAPSSGSRSTTGVHGS